VASGRTSGTYQWPTYLAVPRAAARNATIFDSKNFAPLKPGGEPFFEPRTGDPKLKQFVYGYQIEPQQTAPAVLATGVIAEPAVAR
jgi:hypothetical protein